MKILFAILTVALLPSCESAKNFDASSLLSGKEVRGARLPDGTLTGSIVFPTK